MSLPSKGSRKVTVRDLEYRWHVRKKPTYGQAIGQTSWRVAIERSATESGSTLIVNLGLRRPDNWIAPHQTGLHPRHVRAMIEQALDAGWDPGTPGSAFEIQYQMIQDVP